MPGERMRAIVAWSRRFDDQHLLAALSTDPDEPQQAGSQLIPGAFA